MKKLILSLMLVLLATTGYAQDGVVYHSVEGMPLYGTIVPDATKKYSRLPDSIKPKIREELWSLGLHSAGLSIRFASDASTIRMKWKSLNKFSMNHMTPAGIRGLDLYVLQDDGTWTTMGAARPSLSSHNSTSLIMSNMEPKMREYMLFLSLYDGVDSIYVGIDSCAKLVQPKVQLPKREKPVVMYGTSILQGGCATRPGMAHTNILQRMLNREVINLGFSGNARLDLEICDLMAKVDAGVYVIDVLPNCTSPMLSERIRPFYERLRKLRPSTPILFVESPTFPNLRFNVKSREEIKEKNRILREFFQSLDDAKVYYFESERILPADSEYTVDNAHFTDAGFEYFAKAMYPVLCEILR